MGRDCSVEWSFRVFWNFFSGGIMEKEGRSKIFYFMCGFGSKTPANAHEIKYFSELGIGFASG